MLKLVSLCLAVAVAVHAGDDGLEIETTFKPEDCALVSKSGDSLSMSYKGTLASNGKVFDESRPGSPFTFTIGSGQVIQGWDRGLLDMCVGEKRKLTIPPALGYGDQGAGSIPPGATLVFEVELLAINDASADEGPGDGGLENLFKAMDKDSSGGIDKEELKLYFKEQDGGAGLPDGQNMEELVNEVFKSEDRNGDGLLTMDEFGPNEDEKHEGHDSEEL